VSPHTPAEQEGSQRGDDEIHILPQLPQLFTSDRISTHWPPHIACPGGHAGSIVVVVTKVVTDAVAVVTVTGIVEVRVLVATMLVATVVTVAVTGNVWVTVVVDPVAVIVGVVT